MPQIVATPVEIGPFFVGDRLPNLFIALSWDTGGAVDLGDWVSAAFVVQRLRGTATVMSGSTSGGQVTFLVTSAGELSVEWPAAFSDPGTYRFRLTLTDSDGKMQSAQGLTFKIQER